MTGLDGEGSALVFDDVHFAYPDGQVALQGLDLAVGSGERLAVLGPNGSGKSTFVAHTIGLLTPMRGTVTVTGTVLPDATADARTRRETLASVRRTVGVVFQDPDDQLFMPTVRRDVAFGPANDGLSGADLDARVDEALRAVSLTDRADRAPHHLSLGERRRAALATVLSSRPSILVFDEPSANLDPLSRRELADIVLAFDGTVVVVTHDLLYAAEICTSGVILDAGRVVAHGPVLEVLADGDLLARHRLELPRFVSIPRPVTSRPGDRLDP